MSFHLHLPHLKKENSSAPHVSGGGGGGLTSGPTTPKGCIVIKVGVEGEEEQQRFVVPVEYLNHPLFARLLKEAEEEYGFHHEGAIVIPCRVDYFRQVRGLIDTEASIGGGGHHHHHLHFHNGLHLIHHLPACFRAVK